MKSILFLTAFLWTALLSAQTFRDVLDKGPAGPPVLPPHAAAQILQGNWQLMQIEGAPPEVQAQLQQNQAQMQFNADGTFRLQDSQGYNEQKWQWIEGGRMLQAYSQENPWGTGHIEIESYQNNQLILRITDTEHQQHRVWMQRNTETQPVTTPTEETTAKKSWW